MSQSLFSLADRPQSYLLKSQRVMGELGLFGARAGYYLVEKLPLLLATPELVQFGLQVLMTFPWF